MTTPNPEPRDPKRSSDAKARAIARRQQRAAKYATPPTKPIKKGTR